MSFRKWDEGVIFAYGKKTRETTRQGDLSRPMANKSVNGAVGKTVSRLPSALFSECVFTAIKLLTLLYYYDYSFFASDLPTSYEADGKHGSSVVGV